jgi:hypothetical protein
MLNVYTKGILVCYAFVTVKFNGVSKFSGTVKIKEFEVLTVFEVYIKRRWIPC